MISNTRIKKRLDRKGDTYLVDTVNQARAHAAWKGVAQKVSGSRKQYASINLTTIETQTKEGDTVVVIGKVLGSGNVSKKLRVCALYFSDTAKHKLSEQKGESVLLVDEITKNPKAEGVKIIA